MDSIANTHVDDPAATAGVQELHLLVSQLGLSEKAARHLLVGGDKPHRSDIFAVDQSASQGDNEMPQTLTPGAKPKVARLELLYDEGEIARQVKELGKRITDDYGCEKAPLCLIGTMVGGMVFAADLLRQIHMPMEFYSIEVESYGSATRSSGTVTIRKPLEISLAGKHVLVIDDIVDTGGTVKFLRDLFKKQKPASLEFCALLNKPARRLADVPDIEYYGFEIEDKFVVGYGMDYDQQYRNLSYIGAVEFEEEAERSFAHSEDA